MTLVSKKHYCISCKKEWECPTENCEEDDYYFCSRCFNKVQSTPKFGEKCQ